MAPSFHPTTNAPLFFYHQHVVDTDMSFLRDDEDDVHPEVTDALLSFVYDPLDTADGGIDAFLRPLPNYVDGQRCATMAPNNSDALLDLKAGDQCGVCPDQTTSVPEFLTEFVLPLPPQQNRGFQSSVQSVAARDRRKRISEKTAELSRLIPGGHRLNTAEMLQEAGRHVKLLQAQIGMLALMHSIVEKEIMPSSMAREHMHALLACGGVQERLAAEGKCLVPTELLDAVAKDDVVKSNALLSRDLSRFMDSLTKQ